MEILRVDLEAALVTIYMQPLRNGEKGGAINAVVLADGTKLGERLKVAQ